MIYKHDIIEQREALQHDLVTMLDGMEQEFIDAVCQVVVDRFQIILDRENV